MFAAMQNGDVDGMEQVVASNWVNHDPIAPAEGYEGARQLAGMFRQAFSDLRIDLTDVFAQGDKVAAHFVMRGKNTGSLMGIPPTGKSMEMSGVGMFRVIDGKITDNWVYGGLYLMQQLGVVSLPTPGK